MRDSFVFYSSYADAILQINDPVSQMKVMVAIWNYAYRETEPEEGELNTIESIIFSMAKPTIDASKRNYENGLKGGRPRKTPLKTPIKTNDNDNVNDNVNVNVNDNVNANANDNANVNDNVNVNLKNNNNSIPTQKQIADFCAENNLIVKPEEFFAYYNERGWELVYDWKNLLKKWNKNQLERIAEKSNNPYAAIMEG